MERDEGRSFRSLRVTVRTLASARSEMGTMGGIWVEKWSDLIYVKRILLAACVDNRLLRRRAEAERPGRRLLQQPSRAMLMAQLQVVAVEMGDTVRSCMYIKERTYGICRKIGCGLCVRGRRCQGFWPQPLAEWSCHPIIWEDRKRKY